MADHDGSDVRLGAATPPILIIMISDKEGTSPADPGCALPIKTPCLHNPRSPIPGPSGVDRVAATQMEKSRTDWWSPERPHGRRNQQKNRTMTNTICDEVIVTENRFKILEETNEERYSNASTNMTERIQRGSTNQNRNQKKNIKEMKTPETGRARISNLMDFPPLPGMGCQNIDKFITLKMNSQIKNRERLYRELKKNANTNREDITEIRDGSLLIKSRTAKTTAAILKIKNITNIDVSTSINQRLSQSRCTIYSTSLMELSESELLEDFADRGVVEIKRFKKKINGELCDTPIHLLTFDDLNPPSHIYHGWVKYSTRRYIPQPRQCFKCFKYGHIAIGCRSTEEICDNCAQTKHSPPTCKRETRCALCLENHKPTSKQCIHYKMHQRTQEIKETEKVSHREALTRAKKQLGVNLRTYAKMAQNRATTSQIEARNEQTVTPSYRTSIPGSIPEPDRSQPNPSSGRNSPTRRNSAPTHPPARDPRNKMAAVTNMRSKGKKQKKSTYEKDYSESSEELSSPTKRKLPGNNVPAAKQLSRVQPSPPSKSTKTFEASEASITKQVTETEIDPYDKIEQNLAEIHGMEVTRDRPRPSLLDLAWPPGYNAPEPLENNPNATKEAIGHPIQVLSTSYFKGPQTPQNGKENCKSSHNRG